MTNEEYMIRQAVELGMLRAQVREFRRCLNMVMDEAEGCGDSEFAHVKARTVQTIALMLQCLEERQDKLIDEAVAEATADLTAQRDALAAALRQLSSGMDSEHDSHPTVLAIEVRQARRALDALEEA